MKPAYNEKATPSIPVGEATVHCSIDSLFTMFTLSLAVLALLPSANALERKDGVVWLRFYNNGNSQGDWQH
jgi:hypothetical protein